MQLITLFYILNSAILLLHEIESSYEREWEILRLPGKITGFILLHIPIIIMLFYGVLEIEKQTQIGLVIGIISGLGGIIPFLIHKVIIYHKERFNMIMSNILIYLNILTGVVTAALSISYISV